MSPKSALRVSEGSYSATVISNENQGLIDKVDGDKSHSRYQECMPIDAPLNHDHLYTHVHTTSDYPVSSTIPGPAGVYTTPTVAQDRGQRGSKETSKRSKESEEGTTVQSPSASLRSNWKLGAPPRRYRCTCGREYAQPQGLTRHRREAHGACICMYCGAYAWARPYRFREHLKSRHPEVDPEVALEEAADFNNRLSSVTKHLPQCTSPPAERRLYPSPSPQVAHGVPLVFLPAVSPFDYDSLPGTAEPAEPTMEVRKYEGPRNLSVSFGTNYARITFPPSSKNNGAKLRRRTRTCLLSVCE